MAEGALAEVPMQEEGDNADVGTKTEVEDDTGPVECRARCCPCALALKESTGIRGERTLVRNLVYTSRALCLSRYIQPHL